MTTHRQRQDQVGRIRDAKPCPSCGHDVGSHRGWPFADCIVPDCTCIVDYSRPGQEGR